MVLALTQFGLMLENIGYAQWLLLLLQFSVHASTMSTPQKQINSLAPGRGASTKSNSKRRSEMNTRESERDRNQWPSRYCGGSGTGLDTPSGSQHLAPHAKP